MTVRVSVWSGPRNISTAMMRSWENRPDCTVVDEPFYAAYLARTGLEHPGRDEVLASQPTDPADVVAALLGPCPTPVHYAKQMSHHVLPDDVGWLPEVRHVLLVRDPREVVASYVRSREACEPEDIGLLQQQRMLVHLPDDTPVVDAADFLRDPEAHLRWLCDWLGLDFTAAMLDWPAGPRASDGVWAPYWYDAVLASTGFAAYAPRAVDLSAHDAAVAEACRPAYDELRERRLRI
ncbi:branched chain amino acid aminotransferase [Marmoricola endophyticus]|uniref:Branched chain amino acid aminotransferase n=1 Tax=Marmoricola endophyticus TaxID=2040280 RepID=A0A917F0E0_9ACTN|nr:HAD family hydrolase [Marmoricola endophyticus]GGF35884.1 branched chain amino acid aminotransferase [Marmoricola endophyticus]